MTAGHLQTLYSEVLRTEAKIRYGRGHLEGALLQGTAMTPTCGDTITIGLLVQPISNTLNTVWDGEGCSVSLASASILSRAVSDQSIDSARRRVEQMRTLISGGSTPENPYEEALAAVSRFPTRQRCALLAWEAFSIALDQYQEN